MPDAMDRVQQHAQDLTADSLDAHARQALGARLCLECQSTAEAKASHFGTWRRG